MGALDDLSPSFDPLTGNRYALAGGNPTSFIEWDGQVPVQDGGGATIHADVAAPGDGPQADRSVAAAVFRPEARIDTISILLPETG